MKYLEKGFALPTVVIAGTTMFIALLSAIAATSSIVASIDQQYNDKLTREAAESGYIRAVKCIVQNDYTAQWGSNSMYPSNSCNGGSRCTNSDACYVVNTTRLKTYYQVKPLSGSGENARVEVRGFMEKYRQSGTVESTSSFELASQIPLNAGVSNIYFGYSGGGAPCGGAYFVARTNSNKIMSVGANGCGQLGGGSSDSYSVTPLDAVLPSGVTINSRTDNVIFTDFYSGGANTGIVGSDGQLYVTGNNISGQLGQGYVLPNKLTTYSKFTIPTGQTITSARLVGEETFAITDQGNIYVAGDCYPGVLGIGSTGCTSTSSSTRYVTNPVRMNLPTPNVADPATLPLKVHMDWRSALVIMKDGSVYTIGYNANGQLANGSFSPGTSYVPYKVPGFGGTGKKAIDATGSGGAVGVLTADGEYWSWGDNIYGELGIGTVGNPSSTTGYNTPQKMLVPDGGKIIKVIHDAMFVSYMTDKGNIYSTGSNDAGHFGCGPNISPCTSGYIGNPQKFTLPNGVKPIDFHATANANGGTNADNSVSYPAFRNLIVIGDDGYVYGAGSNRRGQLGNGCILGSSATNGCNVDIRTPVKMIGFGPENPARSVLSGRGTTVIRTMYGRIYTVGGNDRGQLGDGTTIDRSTPIAAQYTNLEQNRVY